MQAVEEAVKAVEAGRQAWLWNLASLGAGNSQEACGQVDVLIEEARWLLLRAVRGSARAARDLHALKPALIGRASKANAYACEILAAMCASGLGADRNPDDAREWLVRAVELLEDHVQRPLAGDHGFMLLPTEEPECAYRPLYTAEGVLITDEIGAACTNLGEVCFDRWGRPLVDVHVCRGPTRATPKSVAARIAREATLEDFAWACRRTTRQFRLALMDARVIAHGRMGFQRCRSGLASRLAAAA
jgi:hypothetical protein